MTRALGFGDKTAAFINIHRNTSPTTHTPDKAVSIAYMLQFSIYDLNCNSSRGQIAIPWLVKRGYGGSLCE
jgi:hypothetical protein